MNFIWRIFEVRSRQFVLSRESQAKTNFISYLNYDGCWVSRNACCLLWSFFVHDTKRKTLFSLPRTCSLKLVSVWFMVNGTQIKICNWSFRRVCLMGNKSFSFHRLRKWWCIVFPLHYTFQFFVTKDLFKWYFCRP